MIQLYVTSPTIIPSRIDRNELYLDIAIEPAQAVEFIHIPLDLKTLAKLVDYNMINKSNRSK